MRSYYNDSLLCSEDMTICRYQCEVMLGSPSPAIRARGHQRGFTLIELIMVMVMLGVLAVFAAPRIFNSDDFYARGFHDETLGLLRYAQKAAIAQRRTVCVVFAAGSATLSIASNAPTASTPTPTCSPSSSLIGPRGESSASIDRKSV